MIVGKYVNESKVYRQARAELLAREIALRDQRERVAVRRRALPTDPVSEDYDLHEMRDGVISSLRFSGLFEKPESPLVIYHFMYGDAQTKPCPSCTMWIDGLNAVAPHVMQRLNFAVVAAADINDWSAWGRDRAWHHLRLVSSAGSKLKADFNFADEDGDQYPGVSVFVMQEGQVRHVYSASAILAEGEYRGIDLLTPVWHLFDLTPDGRGDWGPSLSYD